MCAELFARPRPAHGRVRGYGRSRVVVAVVRAWLSVSSNHAKNRRFKILSRAKSKTQKERRVVTEVPELGTGTPRTSFIIHNRFFSCHHLHVAFFNRLF